MSEELLRWYLVRHGETDWNREMRMQGHTDVPLNALGQEQALRIADRLAAEEHPPQTIWSSDLSRARLTAEAIAAPHNLSVHTTPLLRETMLGRWEGLTRPEIIALGDEEALENYVRDPLRHRPPGGETLEEAWERMSRVATEIRTAHPAGRVAIVGHGGSMRVLLCEALDAPLAFMRRIWLGNASLSIVDYIGGAAGDRRYVTLLNDTSHLSGIGALTIR